MEQTLSTQPGMRHHLLLLKNASAFIGYQVARAAMDIEAARHGMEMPNN
jgi:hypothetical protein